jgi:hypothetical protein
MKNSKILLYKLTTDIENILKNSLYNIYIKTDDIRYPDIIFYFNNNKYLAEYNKNNYNFWCNFNITKNINMTFSEYREYTHIILSNHLGLKNIINFDVISTHDNIGEIEMHFNKLNYEQYLLYNN